MTSTNSLVMLTALDSQIISYQGAQIGNRNGHNVLDFPSGVITSAIFSAVLPEQYASNGLTVYLNYAMLSSSGGNVVWGCAFDSYNSNTLDTYTPGSELTVTSAVPSTLGGLQRSSISFGDGAPINSLQGGNYFTLTVRRLGNNVSDTALGNAELVAVEIKES